MVSRNQGDLTEELEAITFRGDASTLTILRSEADETVDRQLDALGDIDDKASRILRLNVLLVGVVVSALTIASRLDVHPESGGPVIGQFRNIYVELAIASFVLSTALAAVTYTATEYDVGISAENAMELLGAELSAETVETLLVKNYVVRINFNRSVNIRNIPLVTATIVFAVTGVILFTLGTYQAIVGPVSWWLHSGAMALIVAMCSSRASRPRRTGRGGTSENGTGGRPMIICDRAVVHDMGESEAEDELTPEERAEKSLLSGGERVAKGRQRSDRDDV